MHNEGNYKVKRLPSEWENIMANEATDELISKIYKQLLQFNSRKINELKMN